jgi:xanthine dehydrogenase accessory factor
MKTWATLLRCIEAEGNAALVSVVTTSGSAPRDGGAHMIVTAKGYHGTIGGGALEWRAIASAQALLNKGSGTRFTSHALGPELGQCCGGRVDLATEVFGRQDADDIQKLAARETGGAFSMTRNGVELSFDQNRRRLYLYGAGHVGRALILALAQLPFEVIWIDPRPGAFPPVAPENVTPTTEANLADAPQGSLVFIMTHSHALDLATTDMALRNPNIAHVGLIGSETKRARFVKRLTEAGITSQLMQLNWCSWMRRSDIRLLKSFPSTAHCESKCELEFCFGSVSV